MSKNTFCVILGPFFSFFASAGLATSASSARPIKSACVVRIFHRRNDVEADKKKKHEDFFQRRFNSRHAKFAQKNVGRLDVASAPLPGCAGGLLCGLRTCAGVLLRGSVASKLQVGTRGVCHCVLCFRVFLL